MSLLLTYFTSNLDSVKLSVTNSVTRILLLEILYKFRTIKLIYPAPTYVRFRLMWIQMFCISRLAFWHFIFHWYLQCSNQKYQKYARCFNQSNYRYFNDKSTYTTDTIFIIIVFSTLSVCKKRLELRSLDELLVEAMCDSIKLCFGSKEGWNKKSKTRNQTEKQPHYFKFFLNNINFKSNNISKSSISLYQLTTKNGELTPSKNN